VKRGVISLASQSDTVTRKAWRYFIGQPIRYSGAKAWRYFIGQPIRYSTGQIISSGQLTDLAKMRTRCQISFANVGQKVNRFFDPVS
jgi:hypothetical protein